MLLSQNSVEMKDYPIYRKATKDHYIETRIDYAIVSSIPDDDSTNQAFIGVYMTMDDQYKTTIRKVTTITMAFAKSGGFMSVVFLVAIIVVTNIQEIIYSRTLIKSF